MGVKVVGLGSGRSQPWKRYILVFGKRFGIVQRVK